MLDRLTEWYCDENASVFGMFVRAILGCCVLLLAGVALAVFLAM